MLCNSVIGKGVYIQGIYHTFSLECPSVQTFEK